MDKHDIIDALVALSQSEAKEVVALADFQRFLKHNLGQEINITTIQKFAQLSEDVLDDKQKR